LDSVEAVAAEGSEHPTSKHAKTENERTRKAEEKLRIIQTGLRGRTGGEWTDFIRQSPHVRNAALGLNPAHFARINRLH
jgi:hypothetical protein